MEKKHNILNYRKRLDQTLALPDLVSEDSLKILVNSQLLCASSCEVEGDLGNVVQKRTTEVSNFLRMLRSPFENKSDAAKNNGISHRDWKIKQDNDQHRIMYREGLEGSPFHTLLIEGYVDGPIDICLCVGWEATLFGKWWPQFSVPPFKVIRSSCLKKVRIGEEISLIRVKVPWPMATREAVLHSFELEYFQDDLILVLMNTISDAERIEMKTHGFTRDGIPEARDIVRIDLVGGFALQKGSSNRTYFRTILNLDMKIEFVPPALINFISRQLLGSGFKLYKKAVAAAASGDEDFRKALQGPMYIRVQEGLRSHSKSNEIEAVDDEKSKGVLGEEYAVEATEAHRPVMNHVFFRETEEDETRQAIHVVGEQYMNDSSGSQFPEPCHVNKEIYSLISEEQALGDHAATHVRGSGNIDDKLVEPSFADQDMLPLKGVSNSDLTLCPENMACFDASGTWEKDNMDRPPDEANVNSIIPAFRGAG